ncbi:isochorismatase [Rhodomicrobium udaipurense JA643]|uniref:Isochorismatase family protein n=1 Tax=Rhodomicrobium udaipurense TaxID=1202716 RepID=A0A8I1G977_9HYPH|nr:isochorismatase family protein [Rhodomicrobium udaipurense]KAI93755.1 isochorismatase [Rhodomicrobium udaipurense JA643]MBJ7542867.1 isochorismatase family protein [Rhodomicrobium udaipurense]
MILENKAGWVLEPGRCALLIHDMQRHYLDALPDDAIRADLIGKVAGLRALCAEWGVPVFASMVPEAHGLQERGLMSELWGRGPRGDGAMLDPALLGDDGRIRFITKRSYSAFYGTDLEVMLRRLGRDRLIITGIYTSIGCFSTALEAFARDIRAFVVADATADMSAADHAGGLRNAARLCARVVDSGDVRAALAPHSLRPVDRRAAIDVC